MRSFFHNFTRMSSIDFELLINLLGPKIASCERILFEQKDVYQPTGQKTNKNKLVFLWSTVSGWESVLFIKTLFPNKNVLRTVQFLQNIGLFLSRKIVFLFVFLVSCLFDGNPALGFPSRTVSPPHSLGPSPTSPYFTTSCKTLWFVE